MSDARMVSWLSRAVPLLLLMMTLTACGGDPPSARPAESESSSASEFDPLAFEEPTLATVPDRAPTRAELAKVVRYLTDVYTYALRTGFKSPLLEVVGSEDLAELTTDVEELTALGMHVEMAPVTLRILDRTGVGKFRDRTWGSDFLVELSRGPGVVADADGVKVRDLELHTFELEVTVLSDLGRYYVLDAETADETT